MKISRANKIRIGLSLSLTLTLFLYQNCGQVKFDRDIAGIFKNSALKLTIENGAEATNKSDLLMELAFQSPEEFNEMRISTVEDMDAMNIPWSTYLKHSVYSLKELFASDGSKDGVIRFYAEIRNSRTKVILKTSQEIGLDTISPIAISEGILKEGIQGRLFSKNEIVELNFKLEDKLSSTNYSSGINSKAGFKIAISNRADCSPDLIQMIQDWSAPVSSFDLQWPATSPLEAFYVCLFVKDRAGNVGNALSQPLTSQWKLVAGDNNQGNGASVTAGNVRFKMPSVVAVSPSEQVFISDKQFHNIRAFQKSVDDPSRIINLIVGTGKPQGATPGLAEKSGLAYGTNSFDFGSVGNGYFSHGGNIFKLYKEDNKWKISLISNPGGLVYVSVRKVKDIESLIIFRAVNMYPNDPNDASFMYEIPLSGLSSITPINYSTLHSQYKILGNGIVPPSSFLIPNQVTLSKNDSTDPMYSLGYPSGLTTSQSGDIYLATRADGSARGWGHHTIRKLKQNQDGTYSQEIMSRSIPWVQQISYHKITDSVSQQIEERISIAAYGGFFQFNLQKAPSDTWDKQLIIPITPNTGKMYLGAAAAVKSSSTDVEYYLSIGNFSQVYHYDRGFKLIEILGRPVYRDNEPDALLAMVGQPEGIVQAPNGIIYFFDSINHIIRSVNPITHALELVLGSPQNAESKIYSNEDFSKVKLSGSSVHSGYNHSLTGFFNSDLSVLYFAQGSTGYIHAIDLNLKKVTTIGGATRTGNWSDPNDMYAWPVNGLSAYKNSDDSVSLFISRSWHIATTLPGLAPFTGFIETFGVNNITRISSSSNAIGDPTQNAEEFFKTKTNSHANPALSTVMQVSKSVVIDSQGNLYRSSIDFLVSNIKSSNQKVTRIDVNGTSRLNIGTFVVIEEQSKRYVVFQSGLSLKYFEFNVENLNQADPISVQAKALCMPGGFTNYINGMAVSNTGNILLSDQYSGQIIEYFIKDSHGQLVFNICN